MKKINLIVLVIILFLGCSEKKQLNKMELMEQETLGEVLFFDKKLSKFANQSCATCHDPNNGFTDHRDNSVKAMASMGSDEKSIGDRNAPTITYAKFSPSFHFNKETKKYVGGQFWDGRESTLSGQASKPPLNPIEMAMGSKNDIVKILEKNEYYNIAFKKLYGEDIFNNVDKAFAKMTLAIESFEMSDKFSPYDSKYDRFLKGEYTMTEEEELGRLLFFGRFETNCFTCHMMNPKKTFYNFSI